jgi:transposase-like protein
MEAVGFVELLTAPGAERRWSDEAKGPIVAETLVVGVTVNELARRHGVKANHLSSWRTLVRKGVALDRSTLADWVGRAAFELRPVYDALMVNLKRSTKLFMDETRAPVLDPGARKTKTGYFWALARDDRPWGGTAPPGVAFTYAPSRGGQHAERILQGFGGILQVDGYAGYNRLIAANRIGPGIPLAYCWAHLWTAFARFISSGSSIIHGCGHLFGLSRRCAPHHRPQW